jgi:hypothetical protein
MLERAMVTVLFATFGKKPLSIVALYRAAAGVRQCINLRLGNINS